MKKIILTLLLILTVSFLFIGCSRKTDENAEVLKREVAINELPSCIRLGEYKGIEIEMPKQVPITEKDIDQQISYALSKAGESTLTGANVKKVSGYSTIAEYKKTVRKNLKKLNQSSQNSEIMNEAWDKALKNAILIKYPQKMLEEQLTEVKAEYENNAQLLGISYKDALKQLGLEDKDIKAKAVNFVKSDIMVYAIAKEESLTISEEEYKAEAEKRMKFFHVDSEEELAKRLGGNQDLHFVFLADKVMQFVYENAKLRSGKD